MDRPRTLHGQKPFHQAIDKRSLVNIMHNHSQHGGQYKHEGIITADNSLHGPASNVTRSEAVPPGYRQVVVGGHHAQLLAAWRTVQERRGNHHGSSSGHSTRPKPFGDCEGEPTIICPSIHKLPNPTRNRFRSSTPSSGHTILADRQVRVTESSLI